MGQHTYMLLSIQAFPNTAYTSGAKSLVGRRNGKTSHIGGGLEQLCTGHPPLLAMSETNLTTMIHMFVCKEEISNPAA